MWRSHTTTNPFFARVGFPDTLKAGVRRKAGTRFVYHGKNYIRLRYRASISSTLVSRGLPGQQASAKADSARK